MHLALKLIATVVFIPIALAASYLGSFAAIGSDMDLAILTLSIFCGASAPLLFALWASTGWRSLAEGFLVGLTVSLIGGAIGVYANVAGFIAAGGLAGMMIGVWCVKRHKMRES